MKHRNILLLGFVFLLITLAIGSYRELKKIPTSQTVSVSTVTPTSAVMGVQKDLRLYPDPILTPGDIITDASTQQICTPGYSSRVRNVDVATKRMVYQEYKLSYPQPTGAYEVDHFISLELGGSNDIKNLWPEPALPKPGFHEKDEVENYLHQQVCDGKISLSQAQNLIKNDWYAVYRQM